MPKNIEIDVDGVQVSAANPLPVVQGALAAGTNNIGDVDVLSIAAGETHIGEVGGKTILATAATTITRLQTYIQARRAAGLTRLGVLTLLPRSGTSTPSTFEADRQTVNTWIRANTVAEGYVLIDVGNDNTAIGFAGAETNGTNYDVDRVHMTNAGYGIVANYAYPVVLAL